jgi:hypothetical protein
MPARALTLASMLLTIGLGFAAACVARRRLAGAIMALATFAAVAISLGRYDGLAFGSEHVVNVFAMAALLCLALAFREPARAPSRVWIGLAGAAVMLSALGKQVGLVEAVPMALWVACVAIARADLPTAFRRRMAGAFAAGLLAPLALVVARYAVAGELGTLYYYAVAYNTRVYGPALSGAARDRAVNETLLGHYDLLLVAAPLLGWALSRLFAGARSLRDLTRAYAADGFDATVALSAALSLFAADSSLRNFGHYYVQVIPWAALLGGVVIDRVATRSGFEARRHALRTTLARSVILLPLFVVAWMGWRARADGYRKDRDVQGDFDTLEWPICKYLRERTRPTDSIFMWGFDPSPYTACNRRPASRYVFTTFVAGYVPWLDDPREVEEARVTPGSRRILLDELEREMPAVIFDSAKSMGNRSLMDYEFLRGFVLANYCRDPVDVYGPTVWVRRSAEGCPQ